VAAEQPLPSRPSALIGKESDFGAWFELEASVEGTFDEERICRRRRAFDR
jgi:hypothetical protein